MLKDRSKIKKVNQEVYALVFKAFLEGPCSITELEDISGMHRVTLQSLMRVLKRHKVVYISAWEKDRLGRDCSAVFTLGKGRNIPKQRKTPAERQADYRSRQQLRLLTLGVSKEQHV
jgi:hypothetical protein